MARPLSPTPRVPVATCGRAKKKASNPPGPSRRSLSQDLATGRMNIDTSNSGLDISSNGSACQQGHTSSNATSDVHPRIVTFAHLDYVFCVDSFPGRMRATHPKTFSFSDHRMIAVTIRSSTQPRGKGFWILRTSLLDREEFCTEIRKAIAKGEAESADLQPDTRWEFIKLTIREAAIAFAKTLKENAQWLESELQSTILDLEKELPLDPDKSDRCQTVKRELYQLQLLQARESMIRAKVKWVSEGEHPS